MTRKSPRTTPPPHDPFPRPPVGMVTAASRPLLWNWLARLASDPDTYGDFATQVYAFLGRRGSGKTYGAGVLAEAMLEEGVQVVVIDPVGNWWGLRMDADGQRRGFNIPVLGGEHGDLALVPESGAVVADMVVDTGTSVILDVTTLRKGQRKKFVMEFAEQFYHRKITRRSAVHVFVEEARMFVPQKPGPGVDEMRMLGAMEDLVRLGRNYGIGVTLIDQRPQSVNKDALNQAECLAVFQLTGPQERAAIKKWTEATDTDAMGQLGMLSQLPPGECFLWSPQWLRKNERTRFAPKRTYDSSRTPKAGERDVPAVQVLPVDLGKLEAAMAASVQAAKDSDPKELKKRIKELEAQVTSATADAAQRGASSTSAVVASETRRVEAEARAERIAKERDRAFEARNRLYEQRVEVRKIAAQYAKQIAIAKSSADAALEAVSTATHDIVGAAAALPALLRAIMNGPEIPVEPTTGVPALPRGDTAVGIERLRQAEVQVTPMREGDGATPKLKTKRSSEERILDAVAWYAAFGITQPTKVQVGIVAGYSEGGRFTNLLGSLHSAGLIAYPMGGHIELTTEGAHRAELPMLPRTNDALLVAIQSRLDGASWKVLAPLVEAYPEAITKDDLAARSGYAIGGRFTNLVGRLSTLGFLQYPKRGWVAAADILFPEDA